MEEAARRFRAERAVQHKGWENLIFYSYIAGHEPEAARDVTAAQKGGSTELASEQPKKSCTRSCRRRNNLDQL